MATKYIYVNLTVTSVLVTIFDNIYILERCKISMDYEDMLDRAMDVVEQNFEQDDRFSVPEPDTTEDGSFVIYENLSSTAKVCNREEKEIMTFVQNELATNATVTSSGESRFKGNFSTSKFEKAITKYVDKFVKCEQCSSPDTRYENQSGVEVIRCTACGATNPKPDL
jgi:translation initiation factor 2 subunit 2